MKLTMNVKNVVRFSPLKQYNNKLLIDGSGKE